MLVSPDRPRVSNPLILFANPSSGSNLAADYLQFPDHQITLPTAAGETTLLVFNILDPDSLREGLKVLKESLESSTILKVLLAGGDGSLIFLLEDLITEGIPLNRIAIAPLPFGTGNDLAALLGWGRHPKTPILGKNLLSDVSKWELATPSRFDLWEIEVKLASSGYFIQISKSGRQVRKTPLCDSAGNPLTTYSRRMSNYFSVGVDARIGLGFEKSRTRSQFRNKVVYAWEGFKKLCCLPVTQLEDFVERFEDYGAEDQAVIFDGVQKPLPDSFVTLIALNIGNYASSDYHLWETSRSRVHPSFVPQPQDPADGLLEFLVFPAGFGIALEQLPFVRGNSVRLHQGKGPFRLTLKSPKRNPGVYFNIDGEYFSAFGLQEINISLSPHSQNCHVLRYPKATATS